MRLPLPRRPGGAAASLPALALAAALVLWLPQQALASWDDIRERRAEGWGYNGRQYAESGTVRYLTERSPAAHFWSARGPITYLWTDEHRRNHSLPGVLPPDAHGWIAGARAEGREAWVVWLHRDSAPLREYGVADLAALPGLEIAAVLEDGVVFRGGEDAAGGSIADALLRGARPLASSVFALWLTGDGKRLVYVREECAAGDEADIFLDVYPAAGADPPAARRYGYETLGIRFRTHGFREDGRCVLVRRLPEYGVAAVWTGQRDEAGGERWSLRFPWPGAGARAAARIDPGALRARAQRLGAEPFEVYLDSRRLVYVREPCVAADVTPRFFLHVRPRDPADLPEDRRGSGFGNLDFHFHGHGVLEGGRCVAVRELPRYPIASIRTGQAGGGGAPGWEEFRQAFHFVYADGQQMLTVGGGLIGGNDRQPWDRSGIEALDFVRTREESFALTIPVFTRREAFHLLRALPPLTETDIESVATQAGIPPKDARQFATAYRYVPRFVEAEDW